jgi:aryl-alcohol dehydrogenase-like predicted oxidoreductase
MPVTPTEQHWQVLHVLRTIATEIGRTPAQVALNWIASRPVVLGTLVGATTVKQLDANLDALTIELSAQQQAMLDQASRPEPVMTPHSLFARLPARPPYVQHHSTR